MSKEDLVYLREKKLYDLTNQIFDYGDRVECSVTGDTGTIVAINWDEEDGYSYRIKRDWDNKLMWRAPQGVEYLKKIKEIKDLLSFEF